MNHFARTGLFSALYIFSLIASPVVQGQSRIPAAPNNYLFVCGAPSIGDPDRLMVTFFEIPADTTDTLYFAINNPGYTGAAPDDPIFPSGDSTDYYLIGGSGALTASNRSTSSWSSSR